MGTRQPSTGKGDDPRARPRPRLSAGLSASDPPTRPRSPAAARAWWIAGTCAGLFVVVTIVVKTRWAPLAHADTDTAADLNAVVATRGWLIDAADVLSILIAPFILRVATLAVVVALWTRVRPGRGGNARGLGRLDPAGLRWLTLFIAITVGIGGIIGSAVKVLVNRARPSVAAPVATAHGTSFPSGHVVGVTVAVLVGLTALAAVHGRRPPVVVSAPTVLIIVAVGGARLALGVHYLSDVIGGCLLAVAWTATMIAVFTRRIFEGSSSDLS